MEYTPHSTYQKGNAQCQLWTQRDVELLVAAHAQFGSAWKRIADSFFPNRNTNQIKCKFQYLQAKEEKQFVV